MHTTKSDAPASLNNQHDTDGRGLGFQTELQTPSGLQSAGTDRTNQASLTPEEQHDERPKSWPGTLLDVWGPPLKKAAGGAALLVFVAYLGHVSDRLESYGPVRALDRQVLALLDRGTAPDPADLGVASAPSETPRDEPSSAAPAVGSEPSVLAQTAAVAPPPGCPKAAEPGGSARLSDGRIVLNEASVAELDSLPGIGAARAQAIVDLRDKLKGFKKLSDLLRIRGIGHKSFLKLKEQLVLDRPQPNPSEDPQAETETTPDKPSTDPPAQTSPAHQQSAPDQVAAARAFQPLAAAMVALGESAEPAE